MNQMVDDLLQEVEELDGLSQQLDEQQASRTQEQTQLKHAHSAIKMDAHLAALETANTAQEAAKHSHQATEAILKIGAEQKAQVLELNEANFSWRQAVRNASAELKSAKSAVAIMLTTAILLSVIGVAVMGYLFYALTQKEEHYKGEVLDIIKTESTLHNKQITLKVDEMSAMLEILTHEIQTLKNPDPQTAILHDAKSAESPKVPNTTPPAQSAPILATHTEQEATKQFAKAQAAHADALAALMEKQTNHYQTLKKLLEAMQAEQTKTPVAPKAISAPAPHVTTVTASLEPEQVKKLQQINVQVAQQGRILHAIEQKMAQLKPSSTPSVITPANNRQTELALQELNTHLKALNEQQSNLEQAVKKLADDFKAYQTRPTEPAPYSYKAK